MLVFWERAPSLSLPELKRSETKWRKNTAGR